jgi:hypothetical protein
VANSTGFQVGEFALFNTPGNDPIEIKEIMAVAANQLTVLPIDNAYPSGTAVISGPNDYCYNFGGTSHSCPTVAGAAALILSVLPDLTWVELRDILRNSAAKIDQTPHPMPWVDLNGDGNVDFCEWYGYGRLDVQSAVNSVINLNNRADIVIRDNLADNGAVPSQGWHAKSPDIWVRLTNDPIPNLLYTSEPPHQNPRFGQNNYLYLRVKNFGSTNVSVVYVRALIANYPGIEFQYPEDWQLTPPFGEAPTLPLRPGTYLIGEAKITDLQPNTDIIVKMTWERSLVPPNEVILDGNQVRWHPCILAEVSPHDGPPPVVGDNTVKGNNNLAHRNITIDYSMGGTNLDTAVVAGTHSGKGIQSIIIDRSNLSKEYELFLYTISRYLKKWEKVGRSFTLPLNGVKITTYNGKKALSLDYSAQPYSLPLNLKRNVYLPIFVGIGQPRVRSYFSGGSVRITQRRNDKKISPGYEILRHK